MGGPSSRAPIPPPLAIGIARSSTTPVTSPRSPENVARSFSSDFAEFAPPLHSRKSSSSSTSSSKSTSKKPRSPTANANSYCGRHSDQFLFGGHSLGDLWRTITKKE